MISELINKALYTLTVTSFMLFGRLVNAEVLQVDAAKVVNLTLKDNKSLLLKFHKVNQAKLNLNAQRAKFLPTLNLQMLLPVYGQSHFLLSSVSILFPFLLPSQWFLVEKEKNLFEADVISYSILQHNLISNALSVYYTILNDSNALNLLKMSLDNAEKNYQGLKRQNDIFDNVDENSLSQALVSVNLARTKWYHLNELIKIELLTLRQLLGLELGVEIQLVHKDDSLNLEQLKNTYLNKNVQYLKELAWSKSLERKQLGYLLEASKKSKWAQVFNFFNSALISSSRSTQATNLESQLKGGLGINLGLDQLISIQISDNEVDKIKIQEDILKVEIDKTVNQLIISGQSLHDQLALNEQNVMLQSKLLKSLQLQYDIGFVDIEKVLEAQNTYYDFLTLSQKSRQEFILWKISLERMFLSGPFEKISDCQRNENLWKKDSFMDLFKKKKVSMDHYLKCI